MARIRTIKPDFWTDEKIVELEFHERLLFIGLWNFADDQGYLDYSPRRIKMQIFPGDDVDISRALARLLEASLLEAFDGPTGIVLWITHWKRHQRVSNPALERYVRADLRKRASLDESSVALASPLEDSVVLGKGREGKGREFSSAEVASPPEDPAPEPTTRKRATQLPADWKPKEDHLEIAIDYGLDPAFELRKFRDHHEAKGSTMKSWDAAFRTWLNNAKTYKRAAPSRPDSVGRLERSLQRVATPRGELA